MNPVPIHSTTPPDINCRIETLRESPDAVSAENGYYPRQSTCHTAQRATPGPFVRNKEEELALRIAAFRESPYSPDISWMC